MILGAAALAGGGALAFVGSRLAGAFGQLQAVAAVQPAPRVASTPRVHELAPEAGAHPARAAATEPPADARATAANGDEHLLRMLAANPEFARAAEELLNDPDPATQEEARLLLRDLGVEVPEARR